MLPIVSTLIYIISPFDILPDTIPVVGYIDDIAILSWALKSINPDLEEYKKWRADNGKQIIEEI